MNEPIRLVLKLGMWLVGIIAFMLLFIVPVGTTLVINNSDSPPQALLDQMRNIETLQIVSIRFLTSLWFFVLGSCFASFLNVVAWRVPRGRSILGSSHCPSCNTRLSFRDNFPVIGWLRNNGRCRTCKLPISPRYLIVEIVLGTVVLTIVLASLVSGGATLPIRTPNAAAGFERVLFDPQFDLIQIVSGHVILLLFLFTFALVELENSRIPKSIFAFGILLGVSLPFLMPLSQLVAWDWPVVSAWPTERFSVAQFLTVGLGGAVGWGSGVAVSYVFGVEQRATSQLEDSNGSNVVEPNGETNAEVEQALDSSTSVETNNPERDSHAKTKYTGFVFGITLVGLFLGWQSAIVVGVLSVVLGFGLKPFLRYSFVSSHGIVFLATFVHVLVWRWMNLIA